MAKEYPPQQKDPPKNYWFIAKLYGWGWTPATWQGWLVLIVYVAALVGLSLTINEHSTPRGVAFTFLLPGTFLTITLIYICYKTGEKPRWQWGPPKK